MKYIFLNLKRFDVPVELGGVNCLAPMSEWGKVIVSQTQEILREYCQQAVFVQFFPEAHLILAASALENESPIRLGCQSVYWEDTAVGGNFGAFTSSRPASAAAALGCSWTMIGHCEERKALAGVMAQAGVENSSAVSRILNQKIQAAAARGLRVLYCIGETAEQRPLWQETLQQQLELGLEGVDLSRICLAYEPVWAIGPGKTPPGRDLIQQTARFIKARTCCAVPLVYGGGLKVDNAKMLASIDEIDGGLIALTRFQGEIGFYPDEYLEIIRTYLGQ